MKKRKQNKKHINGNHFDYSRYNVEYDLWFHIIKNTSHSLWNGSYAMVFKGLEGFIYEKT